MDRARQALGGEGIAPTVNGNGIDEYGNQWQQGSWGGAYRSRIM